MCNELYKALSRLETEAHNVERMANERGEDGTIDNLIVARRYIQKAMKREGPEETQSPQTAPMLEKHLP